MVVDALDYWNALLIEQGTCDHTPSRVHYISRIYVLNFVWGAASFMRERRHQTVSSIVTTAEISRYDHPGCLMNNVQIGSGKQRKGDDYKLASSLRDEGWAV